MELFCYNVCFLREKYCLTKKQMAQIMGISVSKLKRIEGRDPRIRLSATILCRLCDHFDLSADAVLRTRLDQEQ